MKMLKVLIFHTTPTNRRKATDKVPERHCKTESKDGL